MIARYRYFKRTSIF